MTPAEPRPIPVSVVLNRTAGQGHSDEQRLRVREAFARHGIAAEVRAASSGGDIESLAREALRARPGILVAGGGDGTIRAVASVVRGSSTALGILPLGTLNHFARDLGVPAELDAAVAVIAAGHRIDVDVGEVNGRLFLNNASLGIYPDIVRDRTRQQRRLGRGKYWAMLWATLAVMRRSPFLRLKVLMDGAPMLFRSPFVFIGNNEYVMEGFQIGTRASVSTGKLSVYTTQRCTRGGLFGLALRALFGRLHQADDFSMASARSLSVQSRKNRLWVATDGELAAMTTPLEFRVRPGALTVVVPAP